MSSLAEVGKTRELEDGITKEVLAQGHAMNPRNALGK